MSHEIRTVIVELDYPIDSDDPYLNTSVSDEYYGEGRELVYCKDCQWNKNKEWVDCFMSGMLGRMPSRNFCSKGERRTDND